MDLAPIKERHRRAARAQSLAQYADEAHNDRGALIAEIERLREEVNRLRATAPQGQDMESTAGADDAG